jgi:hypothetical protein
MTDTTTDTPEHGTAGHGRKSLDFIKDEVKFYDHQIEGVRLLATKPSFLLSDQMGLGKAHPATTPVRTPYGLVPISAIAVGTHICKPSGGVQRVSNVYNRGAMDEWKVHLSDGTAVRCSEDHLWTVRDPDDMWVTLDTKSIRTLVNDEGLTVEIPLPRPYYTDPAHRESLKPDPFLLGLVLSGTVSIKNRELRGLEDHKLLPVLPTMFGPVKSEDDTPPSMLLPAETDRWETNSLLSLTGDSVNIDSEDAWLALQGLLNWTLEMKPSWRYTLFLGLVTGCLGVDGGRYYLNAHRATKTLMKRLVASLGGTTLPHADRVYFWMPWPMRLHSGATIATPRPSLSIVSVQRTAARSEMFCLEVDDAEHLYMVGGNNVVTHNSLQALTVAAVDFQRGAAKRLLVVCPATLKWNWAKEIEKNTNFVPTVLDGTKSKRLVQFERFRTSYDSQILIVNYEQVSAHLDDINACDFDIAVFDEAHYLKNRGSKRTKAAHKIVAKRSFMLTGSPVLNHVDELWGILHRISPETFPSYYRWVNRFCVFGGFKAKQVVGAQNQDELRSILSQYMLRRTKEECLDMPDKNFIQVEVGLSDVQSAAYSEAEDELRITIPDEPEPLELENALVKMLRLKQITGTPATIGLEDSSIKLDRTVDMIREMVDDGERVVVFTQFRGVVSALEQRLDAITVPHWSLTGATAGTDRVALVDRWGSGTPGALLSMLQVGGVGLDFTAASNCIFIDKLYVPDLNMQAVDRLHRLSMDMTKPVTIFEMIAKGTVEDRIEQILRRKRKLITDVVEDSSSDLRSLIIEALHTT